MVTTKQINIKNKTYYFYNDLIHIKDFNPRLLKLNKKTSMGLGLGILYWLCHKKT